MKPVNTLNYFTARGKLGSLVCLTFGTNDIDWFWFFRSQIVVFQIAFTQVSFTDMCWDQLHHLRWRWQGLLISFLFREESQQNVFWCCSPQGKFQVTSPTGTNSFILNQTIIGVHVYYRLAWNRWYLMFGIFWMKKIVFLISGTSSTNNSIGHVVVHTFILFKRNKLIIPKAKCVCFVLFRFLPVSSLKIFEKVMWCFLTVIDVLFSLSFFPHSNCPLISTPAQSPRGTRKSGFCEPPNPWAKSLRSHLVGSIPVVLKTN